MTTEGLRFESRAFQKIHPAEFNQRFLQENVRQDGREFAQTRLVSATAGTVTTGQGSATVRVGATTVVCGIKAEIGEPRPGAPDRGFLVPNIELSPLCSTRFRPGPPSDEAQAVSEHLARLFGARGVVDLAALCVVPEAAVWVLHADLVCLNYAGNVLDAAILALGMALASTWLPAARLDEATGLVTADYGRLAPLRLGPRLFPLSFVGVDAHVLADPSDAEESLCDSRLLVVVDDQGGLVNVWKRGGGSAFSRAQIRRCVEMAEAHRASLEAVWSVDPIAK